MSQIFNFARSFQYSQRPVSRLFWVALALALIALALSFVTCTPGAFAKGPETPTPTATPWPTGLRGKGPDETPTPASTPTTMTKMRVEVYLVESVRFFPGSLVGLKLQGEGFEPDEKVMLRIFLAEPNPESEPFQFFKVPLAVDKAGFPSGSFEFTIPSNYQEKTMLIAIYGVAMGEEPLYEVEIPVTPLKWKPFLGVREVEPVYEPSGSYSTVKIELLKLDGKSPAPAGSCIKEEKWDYFGIVQIKTTTPYLLDVDIQLQDVCLEVWDELQDYKGGTSPRLMESVTGNEILALMESETVWFVVWGNQEIVFADVFIYSKTAEEVADMEYFQQQLRNMIR